MTAALLTLGALIGLAVLLLGLDNLLRRKRHDR